MDPPPECERRGPSRPRRAAAGVRSSSPQSCGSGGCCREGWAGLLGVTPALVSCGITGKQGGTQVWADALFVMAAPATDAASIRLMLSLLSPLVVSLSLRALTRGRLLRLHGRISSRGCRERAADGLRLPTRPRGSGLRADAGFNEEPARSEIFRFPNRNEGLARARDRCSAKLRPMQFAA